MSENKPHIKDKIKQEIGFYKDYIADYHKKLKEWEIMLHEVELMESTLHTVAGKPRRNPIQNKVD